MKDISLIKRKDLFIYAKKKFDTDKNDKNEFKLPHKARNHCHYNGKYRGATHNICNVRYIKYQKKSL